MAFTQKKEEFEPTANHKQHLNLSSLACEIMDYDMLTFHAESRSGFLNRVFRNYYPLAEASISLVLNRMQNDLSRLLSDVSGDDLIQTNFWQKKRIVCMKKLLHTKKEPDSNSGSMLKISGT